MKRIQSKIYASSDEESKDVEMQSDNSDDDADSEGGEDEDVDMDSDSDSAQASKKVKAERGGKKALREQITQEKEIRLKEQQMRN